MARSGAHPAPSRRVACWTAAMANAVPPRSGKKGGPDRDVPTDPPRLALRPPEPRNPKPGRPRPPPLLAPPPRVPRPRLRPDDAPPAVRVPPRLPEPPITPAVPVALSRPLAAAQAVVVEPSPTTSHLEWAPEPGPTSEVLPRAQRRGFLLVAVATGVLAGVIGFGALTSTSSTKAVVALPQLAPPPGSGRLPSSDAQVAPAVKPDAGVVDAGRPPPPAVVRRPEPAP